MSDARRRVLAMAGGLTALVVAAGGFAILRSHDKAPVVKPPPPSSAAARPVTMRVLADANAPVVGPLDEAELPVSGFDQPACPTQRIQFHKGQWLDTPPVRAFVQAGAEGDVDGDGGVKNTALFPLSNSDGSNTLTLTLP